MVYLRRYLDLLYSKIDHKDNIHSFATCNMQHATTTYNILLSRGERSIPMPKMRETNT